MRTGKVLLSLAITSLSLLVTIDASAERRKRDRRDPDAREERAEGEEREGEAREGATSDRDDWIPYALRDDIELDARWWSATRFGSTFDFALRGQGLVAPNVAIGFTLPWTFNVREVGDPAAALGNPTLDVHYVARAGIVTWHAGGGLSAPLASIQDERGFYRGAATLGALTLALYDLHLYVPAFMPIRAFGGAEIRPNHVMSIRAGIAPGFYIPLEGNDLEVGLQGYVDVIALADVGFGGGLRLQGVHPLTDDGDQAQMSIEPYLAYDDRESFFTKLGLLLALDERAGFAFDTGKVATLHFAIGGYLDGSGGDSF